MQQKISPSNNLLMIGCTLFIGAAVGLCVIGFITLFAFIHNLLFLGQINFFYDETHHTPVSPFGLGVILVPVIGSLLVTWIIQRFASGEHGLSVPEIIYSIHFKQGEIKTSLAFAKVFAAIISIASGGSLGREGPIVQLGAAFSSIITKIISISQTERALLIAAGAAAGTAVAFNAPLGGLLFVIEILLVNIDVMSIIIILTAEIVAILINWAFFGEFYFVLLPNAPRVSNLDIFSIQLFSFIPFGILLGFLSVIFIRGIYYAEDVFAKCFKNAYLKHATGMFFVGVMIYLLMHFYGHYYIEGPSFATIKDMLNFLIQNPWLLLLLLFCKLISTFFTLGSGASGGVFSPCLFIGGALGTIASILNNHFFGSTAIDPLFFVIAGMAGMLASVTGGVLTTIVLCIEITKDYQHVLPILITVVIAFMVRRKICVDNVYSLKLTRRGVDLNRIFKT